MSYAFIIVASHKCDMRFVMAIDRFISHTHASVGMAPNRYIKNATFTCNRDQFIQFVVEEAAREYTMIDE